MTTGDIFTTSPKPFRTVGAHATNASLATAVTLTPASGATKLLIQALTQNIRVTLDGTTPTATLGFQIKAADPAVVIPIAPGTVVKLIEELATATIQYQWGN